MRIDSEQFVELPASQRLSILGKQWYAVSSALALLVVVLLAVSGTFAPLEQGDALSTSERLALVAQLYKEVDAVKRNIALGDKAAAFDNVDQLKEKLVAAGHDFASMGCLPRDWLTKVTPGLALIPAAFAAKKDKDSDAAALPRVVALWVIIALLPIFVLGCFALLLLSDNPRVVTFALEALKVQLGIVVGSVGTLVSVMI